MYRIDSNRLDQQARNLNIICVCTDSYVTGCLDNKRKSFNEDEKKKFLRKKKKKKFDHNGEKRAPRCVRVSLGKWTVSNVNLNRLSFTGIDWLDRLNIYIDCIQTQHTLFKHRAKVLRDFQCIFCSSFSLSHFGSDSDKERITKKCRIMFFAKEIYALRIVWNYEKCLRNPSIDILTGISNKAPKNIHVRKKD